MCFLVSFFRSAYSYFTSSLQDLAYPGVTSWLIPDWAESSCPAYWQFVSAPQTTPRTTNTCGNIFVLPPAIILTIDNSFYLAATQTHLYFPPWMKCRRVGSSIRPINDLNQRGFKCFCDKFIKRGCHVCRLFTEWSRTRHSRRALRARAFFEVSSRAVKKLQEPPYQIQDTQFSSTWWIFRKYFN